MAKRYWYKREPQAWLHGTRSLTLEERGAYNDILEYLNDRDGPLPDEPRFIAGLLNCPVQRWKKIRERLLALGKIMIDEEGRITNSRFEREHADRNLYRAEQARHAREAHAQREPSLPYDEQETRFVASPVRARAHGADPEIDEKLQESSKKVAKKLKIASNFSTSPAQETAKKNEGTLSPRARAIRDSESRVLDSTQPIETRDSREALPPDADLMDLFNAVCDAAGFRPVSPSSIDRAMRQVEAWRDEGIDFERVVLPTIRRKILDSRDGPTRTLGRFRPDIAHEHARLKASERSGRRYNPPKVPLLKRDDEEPAMADLRGVLAQVLGPRVFSAWFNDLKLSIDEDRTDWLRVSGRMSAALASSAVDHTLRAVARRHGYSQVILG